MFYCTCAHGRWPNFCHYEHQVVSDFLLSLVQEVLRGPLPMGRDKQHYTQPTLFECWNHPGVSHDHLTFLVRAFTSWRTSICKRFFVCELTSYASVLLPMQVETQYNSDIYVFSCELYCSEQVVFLFSSFRPRTATAISKCSITFALQTSENWIVIRVYQHLKMQQHFCTSNFW